MLNDSIKKNSTYNTLVKHIRELIEEHEEHGTLVKEEIGKLKEQNIDYTNQIDKYKWEIEQCQKEIEAGKVKHSTIEPCYDNHNKQVVDLNEGLAEVLKQERDALLKYKKLIH